MVLLNFSSENQKKHLYDKKRTMILIHIRAKSVCRGTSFISTKAHFTTGENQIHSQEDQGGYAGGLETGDVR